MSEENKKEVVPTTAEPSQEEKPVKPTTENTEQVAPEITLEGIDQLEDGSYVFKVDPDYPNSTVYKGKDIN